ncbi:MAG: hypothetical protein JO317_06630, partial [Verrucomicrobiae bacterium]|nr:hypothetical protein [Verrucomicrobiae bacterium]
MSSMFQESAVNRLKSRVRQSGWMRVIRPTRALLTGCMDRVLDGYAKIGPVVQGRVLLAAFPKSGTHVLLEALRRTRELSRWPLAFPNCDPASS